MTYQVDATNQSFGRVASKIAFILSGKNLPAYKPNVLSGNVVTVFNTANIKFTGGKMQKKIYYRYTGYHGGIRSQKLAEIWEKRPEWLLRKAVYAMLAKNKSRDKIIKNLKFK